MPSTYSPNLRIQLIASGEQSGTWGNTTNTNLGTLIEDAIAGYIQVSVTSADQALTALDGAADESRNMVIDLNTTGWGSPVNFNVYIPPTEKFYVIKNSSSVSATIYCGTSISPPGNTTAAGTGVTVPAGRETIVFSDATNIVSAIDYAPTLNLGTALGIPSGGTGQTTYTDGQLLIGNSSGNTLSKATLTQGSGVTITNGPGAITISATGLGGTVTSVDSTFTGGIVSVGGVPITGSGTIAFTIAGTSGGIPYFSGSNSWASSGVLSANSLVIGGGAGVAPSTTTTGSGVLTALGNSANGAGGLTTIDGTATLTNKRIDPRTSTTTSTASITPDVSSFDQYNLTAQAATLAVNAPIGTPVDGNKIIFRILDNGVAQAINWNGTYTAIGSTLPANTTPNKMTYVGCVYNAANTRWDVIAVVTQA